jgi:hypothetical protein
MKKYLGWLFFTLFIILVVFVYMKFFFTYSEGSRSGLLQKFSKKGVVFKTYEGEMILSSVRSSADMAIASEKFFFSVPSAEVAKKIDIVQGEYITVFYREKKGALPWVGETRYLVDSVKVSEHNPYRPAAPY